MILLNKIMEMPIGGYTEVITLELKINELHQYFGFHIWISTLNF